MRFLSSLHPSVAIWITLLVCTSFSSHASAQDEVSARDGVFLTHPSKFDFVEVVRGGELASEINIKFEGGFRVPADGYLVLKFGGDDTILCPDSVNSVEDCDVNGREMPDHLRLTVFNIDLGPQALCVEAWRYDGTLVSQDCQTLVGSDKFQGRRESSEYFQDNVDEFRSDEAHLLSWHRLAASLPLCAFLSLGPLPNSNVFAKPGNCSALQHFALVPDAGSSLFQIKSVSGGGGGGVEDGGAGLEEVWEPLQNQLQDQLQDQFQDQLPEHAAAGLAVHLQASSPQALRALENLDPLQKRLPLIKAFFFSLPATANRTELHRLVQKLERFGAEGGGEEEGSGGFHTFLVGTERLLILNGHMWDNAFQATVAKRGSNGDFRFIALPFREEWYPELLRQYNASGMMPLCVVQRFASFHTAGYEADDCPPVFGVYRSSRLRLFEHPQTPALLHPASLLRFRRNVHSEAGEDGIIAFLVEALGIDHGFCFEFGAWDGVFASNCRFWYEHGWDGLMVEAEEDKFQVLRRNYRNLPNVALVNAIMEVEGANSMGALVAEHAGREQEVTVLSIDVDGLDFLFFSSLGVDGSFRPLIIIVECNGFIRPDLPVSISQEESNNNMQQSLLLFKRKGQELGYTLLCFTQNAIFVRADLYPAVLAHLGGTPPPASVSRLYADALLINWNDMLLNVRATRSGMPPALVKAETEHFGSFQAHVTVEEALERARAEEERGEPE